MHSPPPPLMDAVAPPSMSSATMYEPSSAPSFETCWMADIGIINQTMQAAPPPNNNVQLDSIDEDVLAALGSAEREALLEEQETNIMEQIEKKRSQ